MADNKEKPQKTPKEKARERYDTNKEYRKLQRRDKLPGFISVILIFIIFVGIFTGLYSHYNFGLTFLHNEFTDVDVATPSKVISAQLRNSFLTFFTTLGNASSLADSGLDLAFSNNSLSDAPDVNVYLLTLKNTALDYIGSVVDPTAKLILKDDLNKYLKALGDPDRLYVRELYFIKGSFHKNYCHVKPLDTYYCDSLFTCWDPKAIHDKFVELELCHYYNGELYKYCTH